MNILFVSALLPYPLYSGGQARIYNLLKVLSKKHTITLCAFIRDEKEREYAKQLSFLHEVKMVMRGKGMQWKYIKKALGSLPLLLATYDNARMREELQHQLATGTYDLVHVEPFYVFPSLPKLSIPLVVAEHNIEYAVYAKHAKSIQNPLIRPFAKLDAQKIHVWEEAIWKKARSVITVSEADSAAVTTVTKKPTPVVSNGVDTEYFRFFEHRFEGKAPTCLFVGNFLWAPNVEGVKKLLTHIWPRILQAFPKATVTIVGKHFPTKLRTLLTQSVTLKENVEDIRSVFHEADILLAPMGIGGGTKFKILESMASGTLVITSKEGKSGLPIQSGKEFIEAETPIQYEEALNTVYADTQAALAITKRARTFVENNYDWTHIGQTLSNVWEHVV